MLTLSIFRELHNKSVYFFLVYTHADVKSEIFMEITTGCGVEGDHPREWVIRLDNNLYGIKDVQLAWFKKLKEDLEDREFLLSQVDPCILFIEEMVLLFYVNYCLMFSTSMDKMDSVYAFL